MLKPIKSASANSSLETASSSLLSRVLEPPVEDRRLVVLDMGLAAPATVRFFNQSKCRLHFTALIDSELDKYNREESSYAERVEQFSAALSLQSGIKIDIFLFWDLFCYLDRSAIEALMAVLSPFVHDASRAHSIGLLNARQKMPFYGYGVASVDQLSQSPKTGLQPPVYAHSRRDLNKLLGYLSVDKSCLLSGGRVENIMLVNR